MNKSRTAFALLAASALPTSAATIASESFFTDSDSATYTNASAMNGSSLSPTGTTGFTGTTWDGSGGSSTQRTISSASLTHSHLVGSAQNGAVDNRIFGAATVSQTRALTSVAPSSSTYYLSGLVRYNALEASYADKSLYMGMTGSGSSATGFSLGMTFDNSGAASLAGFIGGSTYSMTSLSAGTANTDIYQIVLELVANDSGLDTINGYYVQNGGTELTLGFTTTAEVFTAASDLSTFRTEVYGPTGTTSSNSGTRTALLDEMRFGTELTDVTTAAIPEPGSALLLGASSLLLLNRRRKS